METTEVKTSSTASNQTQKKQQPFFKKEGEGGFFAQKQEITAPFFQPMLVQHELAVGAPNDPYEQEADKVGRQVMDNFGHASAIQTKLSNLGVQASIIQPMPLDTRISRMVQHKQNIAQSKCNDCEEEMMLQPKSTQLQFAGEGGIVSSDIEQEINRQRGGGSNIDDQTKGIMESSFGADFSNVKIHTGTQAIAMSKELNAHAFTVGNDIFFNKERYQPNTKEGAGLLAHELTHTVQQGTVVQNKQINRRPISKMLSKHEIAHLSAIKGDTLSQKKIAQLNRIPEDEMMQQKEMFESKEVDKVQKKDSRLSLRRCSGKKEPTEREKLIEAFKKKRATTPNPPIPSAKSEIKAAAVDLGTNSKIMDSYHRYQNTEQAEGDLTWGFFFSKDKSLNAATKKPGDFDSWTQFNKFSTRQKLTLFQISRITGEVVHNRYSENKTNLAKLKKAYDYWPSGLYAIHQSGSKEASNTCNVFVGGSLFNSGFVGNNNGKLWSAAEIYKGANGIFSEIDKAYTMPGDIVAYGGHVGVVVTVDVENEKFITREGYIEKKGAERVRKFDELLGLAKPKLKVMRKK